MIEHIGMGTCNARVFHDGLQVVVNLSSRDLTQALFYQKGCHFVQLLEKLMYLL